MKKYIGMGLTMLLLAACGGASSTTTPSTVGPETGTVATTLPVSPELPTTMTEPQATSMPSPDLTAQPSAPTSLPSTIATAKPSEPGSGAAATTLDPASVTQQVTLSDLGMTFKIPQGWAQVANENAWSPSGAELPRIGVTSAPLSADWRPSSMLPKGATVKSSEVQTVPIGQVNLYTVENSDGTAETHTIIRNDVTAYDVYARAASPQQLTSFLPVLNAILNSLQLNEG